MKVRDILTPTLTWQWTPRATPTPEPEPEPQPKESPELSEATRLFASAEPSEAKLWLQTKLSTGPLRISTLIFEWCESGSGDRPRERTRLDKLMDARWALAIDAFVGDDGKMWWRLPQQGTLQ